MEEFVSFRTLAEMDFQKMPATTTLVSRTASFFPVRMNHGDKVPFVFGGKLFCGRTASQFDYPMELGFGRLGNWGDIKAVADFGDAELGTRFKTVSLAEILGQNTLAFAGERNRLGHGVRIPYDRREGKG